MADDTAFQCDICNKVLSRKQTLAAHRRNVHKLNEKSGRKYKLYLKDPNIAIPRATKYRIQCKRKRDDQESNNFPILSETTDGITDEIRKECQICDGQGSAVSSQLSHKETEVCISATDVTNRTEDLVQVTTLTETNLDQENRDTNNDGDAESITHDKDNVLPENLKDIVDSDSSDSECIESEYWSSDSSDSDMESTESNTDDRQLLSEEDEKCMVLLSCLMKHHLSGQASENILRAHNLINHDGLTLSKLKQTVGACDMHVVDFCDKCYTLFPDDETVVECPQPECPGVRFKGNGKTTKQRKCYFACLSIEAQMKDILEKDGVWQKLQQYRVRCSKEESIKDILCGEMYKTYTTPGNFLMDNNNISLLFNTDGVPLYSSSGVSIWPVYLVINELPPVMRFSKNNMILWGVWQAQGKPVFRTFFQPFVNQMLQLKNKGISLEIDEKAITCRALLLAGTLDLQAKATVAEMTAHNGMYGCITCTEPGEVVKQGKGHCRSYPYRERPYDARTTEGILQCGIEASSSINKGTVTGIKGVSCLLGMEWFDIVYGLVPDYMHGVLLGVTKKMMQMMMSSSYSKEPYFIGNHIKQIDRTLMKMLPTDQLSRLPRKLENHLHHLKASEIQNWLLFYSLPCLVDILPSQYLDHLALFIESIYILLGDDINTAALRRAKDLLQMFYKQFEILYGKRHCTLNLHNVGVHLVDYVKQLGPLWAWSCFPFEDMNGNILDYVHGTGDVCQQILWKIQAQKKLAVNVSIMRDSSLKAFVHNMLNVGRSVKTKLTAIDCKIAGGMTRIELANDLQQKVRHVLSLQADDDIGQLYKVLRVVVGEQVFFSQQYSRMSKRICHVVLTSHAGIELAAIQYFVYHENSNMCLAIVKKIKMVSDISLLHSVVNHLIQVEVDENDVSVLPVKAIQEKLLFLNGNKQHCCVARLPNLYGQCC